MADVRTQITIKVFTHVSEKTKAICEVRNWRPSAFINIAVWPKTKASLTYTNGLQL